MVEVKYYQDKNEVAIKGHAQSGEAGHDLICAAVSALFWTLFVNATTYEQNKYGKIAPLMRNLEIIDYADEIYAFWDGTSRGTKYVIENCRRKKKKVHVFMLKKLDENDF
jgi:hypothetical protein